MPTLRQVRYFLAVAETEKVSAAATDLGISQSGITLAVKELEGELGVKLFERRVGGVALTRDGQNFLPHARSIEAAVADAVHSIRRDLPSLTGRIRLGVTFTVSAYYLFPVLARFRRTYPDIDVEVLETERPELEDLLHVGDIDLALMLVSNLNRPKRFRHRTLMRSPRGLWLSSDHPLVRRRGIALRDVASEPYALVLLDDVAEATGRYWGRAGLEPNIVFRTRSLEAVREMVATGGAVTILSKLVYRPWSLDGGRVEMRPLRDPIPTMDIGLVWRRGRPLTDAEETFRDYLVGATRT